MLDDHEIVADASQILKWLHEDLDSGDLAELSVVWFDADGNHRTARTAVVSKAEAAGRLLAMAIERLGFKFHDDVYVKEESGAKPDA
jgi:hypothetical protein